MSRDGATGRISWEIGIGLPGFEDITFTNRAINEQVRLGSHAVYQAIKEEFNPDDATRQALNRHFSEFMPFFKEGPEHEESILPIGSIALENVVSLLPHVRIESTSLAPRKIFISGDSLREEIVNLQASALDYGGRAGNDEFASNCEAEALAFADDRDTIVRVALQMSTARRVLRYGVLPKEAFVGDGLRGIGYETWKKEQFRQRTFTASEKRQLNATLPGLYRETGYAAKNIWRTIWPEVCRRILPFEPDINHMYTAVYVNQIGRNCRYTPTFHDELTTRLPKEDVTDALKYIFAPHSVGLKLV